MPVFLLHRPGDAVGVATEDIAAGTSATGRLRESSEVVELTISDNVPLGHKIAVRPLAKGDKVIEYGVEIGVATADITAGQHVHVHNMKGQRWA